MSILLNNNKRITFGNLDMRLLVEQEDYPIHSFGAGVLSPSDLSERRNLLFKENPVAHYAYFTEKKGELLYVLNAHEYGLEQIFIRTLPNAKNPHFEITISSYERMVDIIKYEIPIPSKLLGTLKSTSLKYFSPMYKTFRDDNIR